MSAIFEMQIDSETLAVDELAKITGSSRKGDQIEWLSCNGWTFHKNKSGEAIVGRLYARLKLAGISPASLTTSGGWSPDFSSVR
ncbi:DUF4224 domain-containing protein [Solimicrobium silvestre]|uniref:DUF4224 domain-containing protein n=1 Tax=Solimicrobium silvestre TaxID=2099400 RepID=A0A2S9GY84_9BURK|nr:hypothetical protein S2091_2671 [Solimicrobium silvestre]